MDKKTSDFKIYLEHFLNMKETIPVSTTGMEIKCFRGSCF
ncbi:hypothetical protein LACDD01_02068 [Lactococcus sp. DD01]|nr:hypothetical protein LACDD01_02068 [Lactococcus sp. DD01]